LDRITRNITIANSTDDFDIVNKTDSDVYSIVPQQSCGIQIIAGKAVA